MGHDVKISPFGQRGIFEVIAKDGKLTGLRYPKSVDVMVFQRVSHRLHVQAITELRRQGVAVVMDLDDDLSRIHRDNVAKKFYQRGGLHSPENVMKAAQDATLVTVTTPALMKTYVHHGRGELLDNYVCGSDLLEEHEDSATFGWGGDTRTRGGDWTMPGRTVAKLVNEGFHFRVVGNSAGLKQKLGLPADPDSSGWVPIDKFMGELAKLGVGMAPLLPSEFNRAKSRLKPIQMAAAGVAWVGSPSDEYKRFQAESGTGLLARTPDDWYDHLKRLLTDRGLRTEMSARGREYMQTQTIERNAWRWWAAWERALEIERAR